MSPQLKFSKPDRPLMAQAVADAVGATKRQVQLWSDAGAIQCFPETDRQGRGRQRLYPRSELPFAAMAEFLACYQIPIGMIREWVSFAREILEADTKSVQHSTRQSAKWYQEAFRGQVESYMTIMPTGRGLLGGFSWLDRTSAIKFITRDRGYIVLNVRKVIAPFVE